MANVFIKLCKYYEHRFSLQLAIVKWK